MFTCWKSTADPRDHFEVASLRVKSAWGNSKPQRQLAVNLYHLAITPIKGFQISSDYSKAICVLLTPTKQEN
jgi:hypothetical protein